MMDKLDSAPKLGSIMKYVSKDNLKYGEASQKARETDNCVICLGEFEQDDEIAVLNCAEGHIFHPPCLEGWFKTQTAKGEYTCPTCRQEVTIEKTNNV